MADLGYIVEWQVLNSRYFGVPQNRERVFIIGHIGDERGREVFPIAADSTKVDKLQGRGNIVSNTLMTRTGHAVGTYPISGGGLSQSERLPQVLISGLMDYKKPRLSDCTMTLDTKTGSLPGFAATYVIEND